MDNGSFSEIHIAKNMTKKIIDTAEDFVINLADAYDLVVDDHDVDDDEYNVRDYVDSLRGELREIDLAFTNIQRDLENCRQNNYDSEMFYRVLYSFVQDHPELGITTESVPEIASGIIVYLEQIAEVINAKSN